MSEAGLVLLVDDDASIRKALGRLIKSAGYRVESFDSAEAFLHRELPDVAACAVLDIEMPGTDGLELQDRINDERQPLGVVFLTGHGDIPASVRAMKNGAVDFLTKPVDEDGLLAAIAEAIEVQSGKLTERRKASGLARQFSLLSQREREVMELVVTGRLNKQIAYELGISEKTVKAHRAQVMHKTGAGSVAELVQMHLELRTAD